MPHKGSSLERRWLVAVPLDHPLAAMERLTPRDIVREDLMILRAAQIRRSGIR
jgi:hypothetical protein